MSSQKTLKKYSRNKVKPFCGYCPECGAPIYSFKKDVKTCGVDKCKNAYQRKRSLAKPVDEKEKVRAKKLGYIAIYNTGQYASLCEWKMCQCPDCDKNDDERFHLYRFEYGWSGKDRIPWKRCPRHEHMFKMRLEHMRSDNESNRAEPMMMRLA